MIGQEDYVPIILYNKYKGSDVVSKEIILYHGSTVELVFPVIRKEKYNKDFYWGFYCALMEPQAKRWATRFKRCGTMNVYTYTENTKLKILKFPNMCDEWLDFIVACRSGKSHDYGIVQGTMVDNTIFNYIQDFIDERIDREQFWVMVKFKYPTHQISFHTARALDTLTFERSYICNVQNEQ